jgi:hypothetical protein
MKKYFEKRITVLGVPMIYRSRVNKSRGYKIEKGEVFRSFHFGKRTLTVQLRKPKDINRKVWNVFTWAR